MKTIIASMMFFMALLAYSGAPDAISEEKSGKAPKIIIIDPGFGGKKTGPESCAPRVYSKDVNLQIAKKLQKKLAAELNVDALLTREDDSFITLEERAAFANARDGDLLISIHTNGSEDPTVSGIETYFLDLAADSGAVESAARENATSPGDVEDLKRILTDVASILEAETSEPLANHVQNALFHHLNRKYPRIKKRVI